MGRLRGFLWLIAGILVAALAAGVAFIALTRATAERVTREEIVAPKEGVVTVVRPVVAYAVLTADDVIRKELPVDAIPENAVRDVDQVIGKITLTDLYPGETILAERLLDPNVLAPDGRLALVMAEDKVLMAFPADDLLTQVDVLKPGDHVDFLFTFPLPVDRETGFLPAVTTGEVATGAAGEEVPVEPVTFNLLQNVTIAQVVKNYDEEGQPVGPPRALLLTIDPQDALVLKYMKDAGAVVDLVLRAPEVEGRFSVEPVDLEYIINGYILPAE